MAWDDKPIDLTPLIAREAQHLVDLDADLSLIGLPEQRISDFALDHNWPAGSIDPHPNLLTPGVHWKSKVNGTWILSRVRPDGTIERHRAVPTCYCGKLVSTCLEENGSDCHHPHAAAHMWGD